VTQEIQSESAAAHLFREEYGDRLRHVPDKGEWIVQVGGLWEFDRSHRVDGMIREFLDKRENIDPRWKGSLTVVRNVKGFAER
jgi:putative DNA primase/helicase